MLASLMLYVLNGYVLALSRSDVLCLMLLPLVSMTPKPIYIYIYAHIDMRCSIESTYTFIIEQAVLAR